MIGGLREIARAGNAVSFFRDRDVAHWCVASLLSVMPCRMLAGKPVAGDRANEGLLRFDMLSNAARGSVSFWRFSLFVFFRHGLPFLQLLSAPLGDDDRADQGHEQ